MRQYVPPRSVERLWRLERDRSVDVIGKNARVLNLSTSLISVPIPTFPSNDSVASFRHKRVSDLDVQNSALRLLQTARQPRRSTSRLIPPPLQSSVRAQSEGSTTDRVLVLLSPWTYPNYLIDHVLGITSIPSFAYVWTTSTRPFSAPAAPRSYSRAVYTSDHHPTLKPCTCSQNVRESSAMVFYGCPHSTTTDTPPQRRRTS